MQQINNDSNSKPATDGTEPTPPGGEHEPTAQVRQGVTGHNVRYVLGFGLAGIIIAFALLVIVFSR